MYLTNEKIFSDVKKFALIFMPINWGVFLIVTIILFTACDNEIAMGYVLGAVTSFLTFGLLMKNTSSSLQPKKVSVGARVFGGNISRLIISGVVLYVAFEYPEFNVWATLAGLTVLKVILIGFVLIRYIFFKDKIDNNQQNEVKEAVNDDITV